jgi:hypothetical protein
MGEGDDGNEDRTKDKDGKCPSIVHIYLAVCLQLRSRSIRNGNWDRDM